MASLNEPCVDPVPITHNLDDVTLSASLQLNPHNAEVTDGLCGSGRVLQVLDVFFIKTIGLTRLRL